jgi:hypothetical protein
VLEGERIFAAGTLEGDRRNARKEFGHDGAACLSRWVTATDRLSPGCDAAVYQNAALP